MKRSSLAAAFAVAVSAAPAPSILATPISPDASASSIAPYPSASSTDPYPSYSGFSGAPSPSATSCCAEAEQITYSIEAWENDVDNVNAFLNSKALNLAGEDLKAAAQFALNYAQDEPTQLVIQCALPNLSQAGKAACATLQEVFGIVIDGLEGVIADPDWEYTVRQNIDLINKTRCKSVLPNLDVLWSAAAKASGAKIYAPRAERPLACQFVQGVESEEDGEYEEKGERGAEEYSEGEKKREEEEWAGENDGFPVFPLPPIRRVAEVPVLTGFPPHVAPSVAPKITRSKKEGKAEVLVLPETPLVSATATLPTLFIPIPTKEGEAEE